jgi:hypothetical protein
MLRFAFRSRAIVAEVSQPAEGNCAPWAESMTAASAKIEMPPQVM